MRHRRKRLFTNYDDIDNMSSSYKEAMFLDSLDSDLKEYFADTRLNKKKKSGKKKKKANFSIGDQVEVKSQFGTIIFGPYQSDNDDKDSYEIEMEDGNIITAKDDNETIVKYVPPVEEKEEDDLF